MRTTGIKNKKEYACSVSAGSMIQAIITTGINGQQEYGYPLSKNILSYFLFL